jgi:hypothetical protein
MMKRRELGAELGALGGTGRNVTRELRIKN